MAKKKSIKQSQPKTFWQKARSLEWYVKLLIVIIIGVIGFQIFKVSVNKHNIALLDEAEGKMRALEVPESLETRYERRCAFKSVKFQSPGKPLCGVYRYDILESSDLNSAISQIQTFLIVNNISSAEYDINEIRNHVDEYGNFSIDRQSYSNGLDCGHYFNYTTPSYGQKLYKEGSVTKYMYMNTGCSKHMQFQIYPESY